MRNKRLLTIIAGVLVMLPMPMKAQQGSTRELFLFCPDEKSGLHAAWLDYTGSWRHIGQICACDYSTWGSEKRMYNPDIIRANDGSWRAVWQLNDIAPAFAAAYSEDLVNWRPQDYPQMSVPGVRNPVICQVNTDNPLMENFMVFFRTRDGKCRYTTASHDFRHFSPDSKAGDHAAAEAYELQAEKKDSVFVMMGNQSKRYSGERFVITLADLDTLLSYQRERNNEMIRNRETMKDDATRFAGLQDVNATLFVHLDQQKSISDKLVGAFFEDISYAADGGLYAEMLQNRDFEYSPEDHDGWDATTGWDASYHGTIDIGTEEPLSENNPHYAVLSLMPIRNKGWDGIVLEQGKKYIFSLYARCIGCNKKELEVSLNNNEGRVAATTKIKIEGTKWRRYEVTLTSKFSGTNCKLALWPQKKGKMAVDMVSLFPEDTFKGHKNGLRRDLAQTIADLHPKFIRFPGGCLSHGNGIDNIYHWTHSIGPLQDRKPDHNIWNYHQTRGLGFFEFFQFCEDIGAEPLPVLAAGVPCQNSGPNEWGLGGQQGGISMEDMPAYIEELCNLIEWANGDPATSKWAKMRADAGHPKPFNLKYIGIGNEDLISTAFEERCKMIAQEIKMRYPSINICGTAGPFHAPSSDYVEGWKFANENAQLFDLIDEHYYESTGWFLNNQHYYDNYDRTGPKVYIGEYASRTRTLESALAEALYLCHAERNGDVVAMTSYAPLLAKEKHENWNPDLIYFTNTEIRLTPSYHTQRLFSTYCGNRYVESVLTLDEETPKILPNGEEVMPVINQRVCVNVVKDTKTGRTCVKLVNALPVSVNLRVEGLSIKANAKTETFSGHPQDTEVKVVEGTTGNTFRLQPYSMMVIDM